MTAAPLLACVVLGGGGHARVVIDALRLSGVAHPYVVLDRNAELWGKDVDGVAVLGGDDRLAELVERGVSRFAMGLGGVGDNGPRERLFERALAHGLRAVTVKHPTAVCSSAAEVGDGSLLGPLAIVNAGATVGRNVIVNSGAIVEHDCLVRDHAHLATGARLAASVRVGVGAHVGAGATVRQGISIGDRAVVGAGAVVVADVPPGALVVGVPAKERR